jgi:2-dehydro-3-deoxy-L-rhamnonate dehydrogenase (NAD+)
MVSMNESTTTVAYVTGASRGIGRLLATSLAESGAQTVGFARPSKELDSLGVQPAPVVPVAVDVTNPDSVSSAFAQAVEAIGAPTLLVTCAGSIDALGPIATVDPERWWQAVTVDLRGTMLCARAAVSLMLGQGAGRIVTVYGNLGDDGREHVSAFAAAKAAVARFTETLASELDGTGVLAVCVHPGFVRTPMTENLAFGAQGRQWLPAFGQRATDHWGDGASAVDLIHQISAGRADRLAGRVIHVGDDLDALTLSCEDDPNQRRLRLRR